MAEKIIEFIEAVSRSHSTWKEVGRNPSLLKDRFCLSDAEIDLVSRAKFSEFLKQSGLSAIALSANVTKTLSM